MFKRRKPDDPPAGEVGAGLPRPSDWVDPPYRSGFQPPPAPPAAPAAASAAALPTLSSITSKDFQMARAPFPVPPSPNAPPAPRPGTAIPPGPQMPLQSTSSSQPAPASSVGVGRSIPAYSEKRTLVVGRGISVQGVVQDAERLVVEGTVEASMIHATELHVAPGGVFRGEVVVQDAEVAGTIDGTLTANGNLVIRDSGRLLGTAKCRRLQVEDGGQVTGRLEMITDRAAEPSLPANEPFRPAPQLPEPA